MVACPADEPAIGTKMLDFDTSNSGAVLSTTVRYLISPSVVLVVHLSGSNGK